MNKEVWIVDDDSSIRFVLERALTQDGYVCQCFENGEKLLQALKTSSPKVIISDIRMPGIDGLEMLRIVHEQNPNIPVIITTAHSDLTSAVNSYQSGSFEYLPKPFDIDEVLDIVKKAEASYKEKMNIESNDEIHENLESEIIGESPAMQEVFRAIGRLSKSSISVLINGQSGTGKELVAHALHKHSIRANKPFIALNMAAIPKELIESELFGHEKGAFTGANVSNQGRFEQANGGTLFLDEIGDMPLEAQTRLLRVLANGEFYRIGGHRSISVDVRIIAATNQNLEKMVAEGKFREDLFYRLNVIRIHIPPLKERKTDIPRLARRFLNVSAKELNVETKILTPDAEDYLCNFPWPGNVRQLENVCRWLTVMASGKEISVNDLPEELKKKEDNSSSAAEKQYGDMSNKLPLDLSWQNLLKDWVSQKLHEGCTDILAEAQPEFEKALITTALRYTHDHKQEAARLLGWGRNTLTRKLKDLNLE
ncbi:MAG: nitrogen regulation protein NR(I) [Ruminobacter sp.]|jgi:two-component system nitrogen regulation response regulator GlnG|uniref:DNA-binding transcriptional regulator NtrC n=1 Tax=Ruminobacter amylophilus TaxID=867 RepID=A0A662ZJA3_9GAMM|nr:MULTISPECIES: nitrogen regulation protein NR(I) [Ruminobacter]MBQ3775334.1 nitrogen regulation protein NR(I) [Ruminobacter sp.]SFP52584.1 two-component system, NtrC family, nitrogen regulation response regulator GlnG [Ruminobacter amylophilus]